MPPPHRSSELEQLSCQPGARLCPDAGRAVASVLHAPARGSRSVPPRFLVLREEFPEPAGGFGSLRRVPYRPSLKCDFVVSAGVGREKSSAAGCPRPRTNRTLHSACRQPLPPPSQHPTAVKQARFRYGAGRSARVLVALSSPRSLGP